MISFAKQVIDQFEESKKIIELQNPDKKIKIFTKDGFEVTTIVRLEESSQLIQIEYLDSDGNPSIEFIHYSNFDVVLRVI